MAGSSFNCVERRGGSGSVNGGNVLCYCGQNARLRISNTQKNPNRLWYGCYRPKEHEKNCNFFLWAGVEDVENSDVTSMGRKDEFDMVMKEIVGVNESMLGEIKLLKNALLKNELVIGEMKVMYEKLYTGCVLGCVVIVVLLLLLLFKQT